MLDIPPASEAGGKSERLNRLLDMFVILATAREPVSIQLLMSRYPIGRRTLFRDLEALREAGVPVSRGRLNGYTIDKDWLASVASTTPADPRDSMLRLARPGRPDWPLDWPQSVALIAGLNKLFAPEGTEWDKYLNQARTRLLSHLNVVFGRKAGSLLTHARLLATKPELSLGPRATALDAFLTTNST